MGPALSTPGRDMAQPLLQAGGLRGGRRLSQSLIPRDCMFDVKATRAEAAVGGGMHSPGGQEGFEP